MKKLKNYFNLGFLFLAISLFLWNCERETNPNEQQNEIQITPIIKTVSYENAGQVFNRLKNKFQLEPHLNLQKQVNELARTTQDTLGVTIYTNEIKEITLGNYTSYTMRMVTPNSDDSKFYNLIIEDKNGESDMFVTKYTPTENWLNNRNTAFDGDINRISVNDFTTVGEDIIEGGGGDNSNTDYPTDCNGMVISTTVLAGYPCGCGHWPGQDCIGSSCGAPQYPGYEYVTTYECIGQTDPIDSGNTDNTNNSQNNGGNDSTGTGSNSDPDTSSITTILPPNEECDPTPIGDLNGDCRIDDYEACMIDGSPLEICDCIAEGNDIEICLETYYETLLEDGFVIIPNISDKVNPAEELQYLDLTKEAKLTVYVQQPKENSDAVVGPNQVGHTFIGIEQGGVTRIIGYYPDKEVGLTGVGDDYDVAIKTNYNYLYHVSISQNILSTQLTDIVNYAINFPPTYNTNDYACVDFAIAIGNLGGMGLPSTTVNSFVFSGRSPGKLGQEIRAMNSTPTTTISTNSANSPSREGCSN